jgi:hypothetical protein
MRWGGVGQRATCNGQRERPRAWNSVARCPLRVARSLLAVALFATPPAHAQSYYVIVSGVGGDPAYTTRFTAWGDTLVAALRTRWGVADSDIVFLAEHPGSDPRINGPATKERLSAALRSVVERATNDAEVFLVLFGHGSERGDEPRFNLVGPDITAQELAGLLVPIKARHVIVIDASSASGGIVAPLSGPGRVVVTATKSGFERNAAKFGGFFVAALAQPGADTDKDGRVSVLEAFAYAKREVARAYDKENLLLTEHAVLDDDGDRKGTEDPKADSGDGVVASAIFFGPAGGAVVATTADPELKALYARRDSLERHVAELRTAKGQMSENAYQTELEATLVDLATTNRAIREKEGKHP